MKTIRKLLFEFVPVLFGVLIALMINDCNDSRKADNLRLKTIEIIKKKSEANIEDMEIVMKNHKHLIEILEHPENETISLFDALSKADGYKNANLKSLPDLIDIKNDIDFEINNQLENIEKQMLFLIKRNYNIMDFLLDNINIEDEDTKEKLAFNFRAFVNSEEETIKEYHNLIDFISNNLH